MFRATTSALLALTALCGCTEPTEPIESAPTFDATDLAGTWIATIFTTGSEGDRVDRLADGSWMNLVIEGDSSVTGTAVTAGADGEKTSLAFSGRWRAEVEGLVFEVPLPLVDDLVFLRSGYWLEATGMVDGEPTTVRLEKWIQSGRFWHRCPSVTVQGGEGLEVVVDSAQTRWTYYTFRNLSDEDIRLLHRGPGGKYGPIAVRFLRENGSWQQLGFVPLNGEIAWVTLAPGDCGKALVNGVYEGPGRYRLGVRRGQDEYILSDEFELD